MTATPPDAPPASAAQAATRRSPPAVVPTLTEVIDWPAGAAVESLSLPAGGDGAGAAVAPPPDAVLRQAPVFVPTTRPSPPTATPVAALPALAPAARLDDEEIADNVLAAVQAALVEADGPLDQRLRDILEPALARFAETLVADVRADFAAALRDVAAEAVVQELGRYRRG